MREFDREPRAGESRKAWLARLIREGCPAGLWCELADRDSSVHRVGMQRAGAGSHHSGAEPAMPGVDSESGEPLTAWQLEQLRRDIEVCSRAALTPGGMSGWAVRETPAGRWAWAAFGPLGGAVGVRDSEEEATERAVALVEELRGGAGL